MINGNSLYGQGHSFTYQLAIAMAGVQGAAVEPKPEQAKDKSFQRHLEEALSEPT